MERFYSKIIGTPIFEDDNLRPLTTVKDLIVDTETGKLLAFIVNINSNLLITPLDISSWHDVIHVHNRDAIIEGNDVLRVETLQKNGIRILKNQVETKGGKYLGKVIDYSIDCNMMDLKKLFVAKGFLGLFRYESRLIPVKNIIEVLPDKIVVKDEIVAVKEDRKKKVTMEDMALSS